MCLLIQRAAVTQRSMWLSAGGWRGCGGASPTATTTDDSHIAPSEAHNARGGETDKAQPPLEKERNAVKWTNKHNPPVDVKYHLIVVSYLKPPPQSLPVRQFSHYLLTATHQPGSSSCFLSASLWPRRTVAAMLGTDLREGQQMMVSLVFFKCKLVKPFVITGLCCVCVYVFTLVVMPNSYFPHTSQAGICCNMEDIKSVAREGSSAVEMAVSTAAFTSVQTDSHMSRGACRGRDSLYQHLP